jgi:hypothetical protein
MTHDYGVCRTATVFWGDAVGLVGALPTLEAKVGIIVLMLCERAWLCKEALPGWVLC